MKKRTTIIGALIAGLLVILGFLIAIVLAIWFSNNFQDTSLVTASKTSYLMNYFLNLTITELFGMFLVIALLSSLILLYISSNIKANFAKFNQHFNDAVNEGKMIDDKNLNFQEFAVLAQNINKMTKKNRETKKVLEFNEKYLENVLNAQKNIVIVRSQGKMERANKAFFNFLKLENFEEFSKKYTCISELFESDSEEGYLTRKMDDTSWVNYILMHPMDIHKVKITKDGVENIFEVSATVTDVYDMHKVVVTFHNISELEEQRKSLELASTTDALTGVSNRFKFDMILEQQIEMSKRYNHSFCMILFDIDNFKQINDTYGHQVGDNILVELADLVKNSMRRSDTFARWGGEEFAIILPQSRLKTAVKIAEKLCLKISFHQFKDDMRITCSFGVAEYKKEYSVEDLLKKVDEKLYVAKERGKDQVRS